jgi:hypothetical protein
MFSLGIFVSLLLAIPVIEWASLPRHHGRTIRSWWKDYLETQHQLFWAQAPISPQQFEALRLREEQAVEAIKQMKGDAGKFLAGQFFPRSHLSAYASLHERFVFRRPWLAKLLPPPEDPRAKTQAARSLLAQCSEARPVAQRILIAFIAESDAEQREQLAWVLTGSGWQNSYPAEHLAACLRFQEGRLSEWAAVALPEQGTNAIPYAADIRAAIRSGHIEASSGVRALHKMGVSLWTSLPSLNRELSRTNVTPTAALNLASELGTNRVHLLPGLSGAVQHPDARFAALAIKSVARMADLAQPLAPALSAALDSPWYFVRSESVTALETIGSPALEAALPQIRALAYDPHPDVSNAVRRVLASQTAKSP